LQTPSKSNSHFYDVIFFPQVNLLPLSPAQGEFLVLFDGSPANVPQREWFQRETGGWMGGRSRTAFGGGRLLRVSRGHTSSRSDGGAQGGFFCNGCNINFRNHFQFMNSDYLKTVGANPGKVINFF